MILYPGEDVHGILAGSQPTCNFCSEPLDPEQSLFYWILASAEDDIFMHLRCLTPFALRVARDSHEASIVLENPTWRPAGR
ncbi:hypothetical protein [Capillimicrobium parvum]|uniref:Uncharacterized protein n=1 Tax=Capillimicrobium parvum TaxID=2884022 RepID=A0A9E6XU97_9ACTN|nr:hypothetical protein [Capillimicrobium parvum]UGS34238.1 hypothetical protein DSM104329_00611 [Capillimicrobium parvum]